MANYISKHTGKTIDDAVDVVRSLGYAVCGTAAATAAKTANIANYSLKVGVPISIKFTYAVPANATLNISSTGAKPLFYGNKAVIADLITANTVVTIVYDGTNYIITSGILPHVTSTGTLILG